MCVARAWHLASAAVPAACCAEQRLLPAALDSGWRLSHNPHNMQQLLRRLLWLTLF
jgi:hypothetical protein